MHHKVRTGNTGVYLPDAVDGQNIASGGARKLVRAVACAAGNSQRIYLSGLYKLRRLFRIRQHLLMGKLALRADTILLTRLTSLK